MTKNKARVVQMAHLKQNQISDNSCKAIIIDTILETVHPLTQKSLSNEIASLYHVLVSTKRLDDIISKLISEDIILIDSNDFISINPIKEVEYIAARQKEQNLRKDATNLWIEHIRKTGDVSNALADCLSSALPIFLRSLFVKHGVSSYELLTVSSKITTFDLAQIADKVSKQYDEGIRKDISFLLPTIFQALYHTKVVEYLKHSIEKAVGYISEVISEDNLTNLTNSLKDLVIYLDTNTIYRLLNLQGSSRYESIKETLDFCKQYGVKLKISATTKKELTSRLSYDARVLLRFPTRTNLVQAGYKYRISDNYVSTYWLQAQKTHISVSDYVEFYKNFDVLLEQEQVEIENIVVDEGPLMDNARHIFERLSIRDTESEKSEGSLWHDAYNIAYIQKMQKVSAQNAIDTHCLFLTTDQSLTAFQREDFIMRDCPPVVIAPSQLLQMFAFSRADSGYEETFIKFFASSSLGVSFKYDNNDIQEILSRIEHYNGVSLEAAEKILLREITNDKYRNSTSDTEREEIIYNSISDELISELNLTKKQVAELQKSSEGLSKDKDAAIQLLEENDERYQAEREKYTEQIAQTSQNYEQEKSARQTAEESSHNWQQYSKAQENLYIAKKLSRRRNRIIAFLILSSLLSLSIIALSVALVIFKKDNGWFGLLGILTVPGAIIPVLFHSLSSESKKDAQEKYVKLYRKKVNDSIGNAQEYANIT